jgi:site-specific recombinase XerD
MVKKLVLSSPNANENITPHSFRRSFATEHSRKGTPIEHLQKLMGHASIKTTQRYILITEEDLSKYPTPLTMVRENRK